MRDKYTYNNEKWGDLFNLINKNDLNIEIVNGYIIYYILYLVLLKPIKNTFRKFLKNKQRIFLILVVKT